jgi:putative membrane protein
MEEEIRTARVVDEAEVRAIERPDPKLLTLYTLYSLAALFAFPFVFLPLYFKYHTLRYAFDDEGISASWGILFKKEIYLTYRRIQDIHVSRNIIERWLGIGRVDVQTASGSSGAELSIEGMRDYALVRDFLYAKMRGTGEKAATAPEEDAAEEAGGEAELVALLRATRDEIEAVRKALEARG